MAHASQLLYMSQGDRIYPGGITMQNIQSITQGYNILVIVLQYVLYKLI
jgi:hypothetical protein